MLARATGFASALTSKITTYAEPATPQTETEGNADGDDAKRSDAGSLGDLAAVEGDGSPSCALKLATRFACTG